MRILVTGGAGFIGSNFIRHMMLNHDDLEIVNFDLLTYAGRLENLQDVKNDTRYRFIHGDIRNIKAVNYLMKERFDLIVNFAAETHVDRSLRDGGSFILTNVHGTHALLDAARKWDVERFLQISTDEVYGSITEGSFKETDNLNPSSPYSASKAAGDHIALAFYKTYGCPVLITRSSNNYGPYQYPEKFIPKLILRTLHDQPLPIYGNGKQVRDWLHVTDNCIALDLIVNKGKVGEIYNIASGEESMNVEVARKVLKTLKKTKSLMKTVPDRPGHDFRYSLDTTKIRGLGWKPKINLVKGLEKTISWYSNNQWWWKNLLKDEFFNMETPHLH
ncbi:MAG: dTDP-glucose 4,6-dehydratase [Candidatus Bathyarchaeota archaeon]|nr:MAG: dTDP-glucose 4,6-dehydratase [Candidatus Bathyarchaeota archaeon]